MTSKPYHRDTLTDRCASIGEAMMRGMEFVIDANFEQPLKEARASTLVVKFHGTDNLKLSYINQNIKESMVGAADAEGIYRRTSDELYADVSSSTFGITFGKGKSDSKKPLTLIGRRVNWFSSVAQDCWMGGDRDLPVGSSEGNTMLPPQIQFVKSEFDSPDGEEWLDHAVNNWGPNLFTITQSTATMFGYEFQEHPDNWSRVATLNSSGNELKRPDWSSFPQDVRNAAEL